MSRWLVVGISGVTSSGKTTLAKKLHEKLKTSVYINQDDYYLPPDDPRHVHVAELDHHNWDIVTSVNMEKMHSDILKLLESSSDKNNFFTKPLNTRILIIDGIFILNYKPLLNLCQLKYFMTLTKQQCWERRKFRVYDPPDPPGYFDIVVWPEHVKYKEEIDNNQELRETITFIDGSVSKEKIFQKVFSEISMKLQSLSVIE